MQTPSPDTQNKLRPFPEIAGDIELVEALLVLTRIANRIAERVERETQDEEEKRCAS